MSKRVRDIFRSCQTQSKGLCPDSVINKEKSPASLAHYYIRLLAFATHCSSLKRILRRVSIGSTQSSKSIPGYQRRLVGYLTGTVVHAQGNI